MGTYHFMGLGRAVGAVTCAVDYIEKTLDLMAGGDPPAEVVKFFHGSGGIRHAELDKGKIEALVLFTSKEVIENRLSAFAYSGNEHPGPVRNEVLHVLKKVWRRADADAGRKIFWCQVEIDDFQDCFDKIVKVAYRFSPPGKQGKEIWCNLTGGSNSIGFALLSMARLTGLSIKNYLIAQRKEFQKEIEVPGAIKIQPNKDGYFSAFPFLKTHIDTASFYEILMELPAEIETITTQNLFDRLRGRGLFLHLNLEQFRKNYMLKLHGLGYTEFDRNKDLNSINLRGLDFLNELEHLENAITLESKLLKREIDLVAEAKKWPWFGTVDEL
ncbi:hypothetical protein FBQ85_22950 [Cytophagia bacterium CHB2]|nr:hypothetical protein [Cytophagia bacterium CHB2]